MLLVRLLDGLNSAKTTHMTQITKGREKGRSLRAVLLAVAALVLWRAAAPAYGCTTPFQDAGGGVCTATFVYVTDAPQSVSLPVTLSVITATVSGAEGGPSLEVTPTTSATAATPTTVAAPTPAGPVAGAAATTGAAGVATSRLSSRVAVVVAVQALSRPRRYRRVRRPAFKWAMGR